MLSYEKHIAKSEHLILCTILCVNLFGPMQKKTFSTIQVNNKRRRFVYGLIRLV